VDCAAYIITIPEGFQCEKLEERGTSPLYLPPGLDPAYHTRYAEILEALYTFEPQLALKKCATLCTVVKKDYGSGEEFDQNLTYCKITEAYAAYTCGSFDFPDGCALYLDAPEEDAGSIAEETILLRLVSMLFAAYDVDSLALQYRKLTLQSLRDLMEKNLAFLVEAQSRFSIDSDASPQHLPDLHVCALCPNDNPHA